MAKKLNPISRLGAYAHPKGGYKPSPADDDVLSYSGRKGYGNRLRDTAENFLDWSSDKMMGTNTGSGPVIQPGNGKKRK